MKLIKEERKAYSRCTWGVNHQRMCIFLSSVNFAFQITKINLSKKIIPVTAQCFSVNSPYSLTVCSLRSQMILRMSQVLKNTVVENEWGRSPVLWSNEFATLEAATHLHHRHALWPQASCFTLAASISICESRKWTLASWGDAKTFLSHPCEIARHTGLPSNSHCS